MHLYLHFTMYLFKTISVFSNVNIQVYLHSTMYLFKTTNSAQQHGDTFNLHSTMYLFKLPGSNNATTDFVFTFHYVSI